MLTSFKKWWCDDRAVIAIEAGILMPVMLVLMMGVVDTGMAVLINQKVINASQTVADLLGRNVQIATVDINDSVEAGRLALMPYNATSFGADIAGIQFNGGPTMPTIIWRDTVNMDPNLAILDGAQGLGKDQEGVLGVTVQYKYTPLFTGTFTGTKILQEVSYVRGRNGLFIPRV